MLDVYSAAAIAYTACPCCHAPVGSLCRNGRGKEIQSTTHWGRRAEMKEWRKKYPKEWANLKAAALIENARKIVLDNFPS